MEHTPTSPTKIVIRLANNTDIEWINARYDEVGFVHSNIDNELIAIAEQQNQRCGIGRLVKVTSEVGELGGMVVLPEFRGQGIAKKIVKFLLSHASLYKHIYCLPFAHLENFYKQFGFKPNLSDDATIPAELAQKHNWCNETYNHDTLLFKLTV